jgi:hypothetical protein
MSLTLLPDAESPPSRRNTDRQVMSGELRLGRIYQRAGSTRSDAQWMWAINGVHGGPHDMRRAGMTATFEQAHAELSGNWDKWLAWAGLREDGSASVPSPAIASAAPPASVEDSLTALAPELSRFL